ncbi:MAG: patatin-like phospholipase family protein [Firmicutes bacterium]|nr:patatin-like phospholipase family protein [Bacillota bacterium]
MTSKKTGKTALVLSGGGSRGAYQAGAWRALEELGIKFDMVVGVSVGAINGAMVVQNERQFSEDLWRRIEADKVFKVEAGAQPIDYAAEALKQGGVSSAPLQKLVNKYVLDDVIRKSPIDFGLLTVELPAYKLHYLWKDQIPTGQIPDYVVASASVFPGVKPKEIDGKYFVDGGAGNSMPIRMAVERGATKVVAIYLKTPGRFNLKEELAYCENTVLIQPNFDLGNFLVFDTENSSRLLRLGYLDTMRAFNVYDGKSYSFIKGEFDKKDLAYADAAANIFEIDPLILYSKETFLAALEDAVITAKHELAGSIKESKSLIKRGFSLDDATGDLRKIREILKSANKKSSTLFMATDMKNHGEKSIFNHQYAHRILGEQIGAARFINKYIIK